MALQRAAAKAVTRRAVFAAMPAGALAGLTARQALAQPVAADPVSFYLGQVLALATLQAEAIGRLRPLLAAPNTQDAAWQSGASAEAGVVAAVASVLGAMETPPELTASVGELRLASTAYQGAASAASNAAGGDDTALPAAGAGLAEGAAHILLWLDALTAETGNDWGDGLRTLTLGVAPVPVEEIDLQPPAESPAETTAADPGDGAPANEGAQDDEQGQEQERNRQNRQARQDEQGAQAAADEPNRQNRQNRQDRPNRQNRDDGA